MLLILPSQVYGYSIFYVLLQGDSGGPLSCYQDGKWYVAGVGRWPEGQCGQRPEVYTLVSDYLGWIEESYDWWGSCGHKPQQTPWVSIPHTYKRHGLI